MEGVGMSPRGEQEAAELGRLEARMEAKYCLYHLSGLNTLEVIQDYEHNLGELKELAEEVVVRVQERLQEEEKDEVASLLREKMMSAREKLMVYMSKMRLKEKELRMKNKEIKTEEMPMKTENTESTTTEPSISNPSSPAPPALLPALQLPIQSSSSRLAQEAKNSKKAKARKRKWSKGNVLQEQLAELQASPHLAPYEQVKLDNLLEQARLRDIALGALGEEGRTLGAEVKAMEEEKVKTMEERGLVKKIEEKLVTVKKLKIDESAKQSLEENCNEEAAKSFEKEEAGKFDKDTEKFKTNKRKDISKTKSFDAASNDVLVADREARAGRCCLCAYTTRVKQGDRRRAVLVHQAYEHFRLQVTAAVPPSNSSCPSCSFTPSSSAKHLQGGLLKHWASVHPTLLTWVQARYDEQEKKKEEETCGASEESSDDGEVEITEIGDQGDPAPVEG